MNFKDFASDNIVILDGGMGTLLEAEGLSAGELPERWNISHPDKIRAAHLAYFDAGSNVVNTNTFGANSLKFSDDELEIIIPRAIALAKEARDSSKSDNAKFISLDIGPLGRLLKPFGDLSFDEAYECFAKTVRLGVREGVDLVTVETMNDLYETKAALLAVKDNCDLPVIVTNAYGKDGKLMSGASCEVCAALLESMGADYIGANCSEGPATLLPVAKRLVAASSVPVVLKPNAGLPEIVEGKTVFNVGAPEFVESVLDAVRGGVRLVGGCCGTTPEYIKALSVALCDVKPLPVEKKNKTVITSFCKAHTVDGDFTVIGESINPTGRKRIKEALREADLDYLVGIAEAEEAAGAHALDVNVGLPDICEADMLERAVDAIQYSVTLPLVIDSSDPVAMERALRAYNGKALINSVSGKESSMQAIFPLMKRYGGAVIALTLDENGIPDSADGRVAVARKILEGAQKYGIDKKDIIFDPLALTVGSDKNSARVTLGAIRKIVGELGCKTSLGVSNISFGLPKREAINSAFLAMAAAEGLSLAIMNPASFDMMRAYYSIRALLGYDDGFADYISAAEGFSDATGAAAAKKGGQSSAATLGEAIIRGLSDTSVRLTEELLKTCEPMAVIQNEIIPALDTVGVAYESGKVYLPGLLSSAECSSRAFEVIKRAMPSDKKATLGRIVIATVKGDIHDIGKNIVKLLLENYGFGVEDLGRDVSPEKILEAAKRGKCDIVALSALMTTTVPAMEETIRLVKRELPAVKLLVGGAVLTESYAKKIGADAYAADAMGAVRYAKSVIGK